jgi:hypothetical protein
MSSSPDASNTLSPAHEETFDIDSLSFAEIGGVVISPVVGLLGAATGYYYGRGDR